MGAFASEVSDEELVSRTVRGDRAAFGQLYDRVAADVQRFLVGLRLDLDHQEIEDAVQETFLRLHRALGTFDARRPLKPFVLGVARRVALELERRGRPSRRARELEGEVVADTGEAAGIEQREREALTARALVALEAEDRTLVVFRFVNGLGMQELADALGCSVPTARARLKDAVRRFQRELAKAGVAPEDIAS